MCRAAAQTKKGAPKDAFSNNGRGGEIRTRDHYTPSVVRYQAALHPDEQTIVAATSRSAEGGSATKEGQDLFELQAYLADDLVRHAGFHAGLGAFQPGAGAGDGEALVVQQGADLADHEHVVALVIATVAAALDGLEGGKLLLPVTKDVRLDAAKLADLTDGEVALRRDRRKFGVIPWIQQSPRLLP